MKIYSIIYAYYDADNQSLETRLWQSATDLDQMVAELKALHDGCVMDCEPTEDDYEDGNYIFTMTNGSFTCCASIETKEVE